MMYKDVRKQEMYDWFHERFAVPSPEGGNEPSEDKYLYSCGGPYCPKDIVSSNFSGIFPADVINEVIRDLERENREWVMRRIDAPSFL